MREHVYLGILAFFHQIRAEREYFLRNFPPKSANANALRRKTSCRLVCMWEGHKKRPLIFIIIDLGRIADDALDTMQ